jgi:hypothetical protein
MRVKAQHYLHNLFQTSYCMSHPRFQKGPRAPSPAVPFIVIPSAAHNSDDVVVTLAVFVVAAVVAVVAVAVAVAVVAVLH